MTIDSATGPRTAPIPRDRARRGLFAIAQDVALLTIAALFFSVHIRRVAGDGVWTSIPFVVQQGVLLTIFLTRRRSVATSARPADWVVAALGGWLPLALRPAGDSSGITTAIGLPLQMLGLCLSIACFLALGRSFGVVAANRGLKTHGPYRFVRHPVYFSHAMADAGFLVVNFSPLNMALIAAATTCQLLRIRAEERVLTDSADYAAYREQVRWRLIPRVY